MATPRALTLITEINVSCIEITHQDAALSPAGELEKPDREYVLRPEVDGDDNEVTILKQDLGSRG